MCLARELSVSKFLDATPGDDFEETLPSSYKKYEIFDETSGPLQSCLWQPKTGIFKPNHDVLITLTKWFYCLNLTTP